MPLVLYNEILIKYPFINHMELRAEDRIIEDRKLQHEYLEQALR